MNNEQNLTSSANHLLYNLSYKYLDSIIEIQITPIKPLKYLSFIGWYHICCDCFTLVYKTTRTGVNNNTSQNY